MDLPHSDACFVKAYPAETSEAFCDGYNGAFAFFGKVPRSILYDNTKLAVARILGDGVRQRTRVFSELQSHYVVADRFGRPGKGNDKGKVEGLIGWIRRNLLVPVPRAVTLTALNEQLLEGCRRRLGDRLRSHEETIGERLVRDLEAFHGLPLAPYDACEKKAGRVSSQLLVRYRGTDYSVPVKRQAIGTPDRHRKGTPHRPSGRLVPVANRRGPARVAQCPHERRSGARGRCLFAHGGKPGWHSGAVFEAPALVAGFDDFAMMGEAVEERGCHLGVAKHTRPIGKRQIGGDDDGSALVKPADQMKEQLAAGLSEGEVAEFVENDESHAREIFGEPPLPVGAGFILQPIDEVDNGVEAAPGAAANARPRNRYGEMRLAGAGSADQHRIALFGEKGAARQITDQRLVDRRAGEVETVDVLGQRQLGDSQLIFDRARLFLGDLGTEQIADDPRRLVPALDPGGHHLVVGCPHAVEL